MKIITTSLCLLLTLSAISQARRSIENVVKQENAINLRFDLYQVKYPLIAKEYGIQGKVQIIFDIDSTCSLINRRVLKGLGAGCDEEAIKALDIVELELKKTNGNRCPIVKNWTHDVPFHK